jgi:hypothetical protein
MVSVIQEEQKGMGEFIHKTVTNFALSDGDRSTCVVIMPVNAERHDVVAIIWYVLELTAPDTPQ